MSKDKIIVIVRNSDEIIKDKHRNFSAIVLIPHEPLELSQKSSERLEKTLKKLLLDPKRYLLKIEEDKLIGKEGSIKNVEIQREFSLLQRNINYQ